MQYDILRQAGRHFVIFFQEQSLFSTGALSHLLEHSNVWQTSPFRFKSLLNSTP